MVRSTVEETTIAEVAVNAPLRRVFHYRIPPEILPRLLRGHRVLIPFGGRTTTGVCVGFPGEAPVKELKPIREILHPDCRFDEHLLALTEWIAGYYHAPWGEVLEAALPPGIRSGGKTRTSRILSAAAPPAELRAAAEKAGRRSPTRSKLLLLLAESPGPHRLQDLPRLLNAGAASIRSAARAAAEARLLALADAEAEARDPFLEDLPRDDRGALELSGEQAAAVSAIAAALRAGGFAPFLLHGVTGSGKTEVYIRALREAVEAGKGGLVLVPEIALTPQTVSRFRAAFPGERVAVLHSMLSERDRAVMWREIQDGTARVAIGARSAVFAPFPRLGVIIVDEEHEPSYKQESSPRYHARDVAVVRARLLGIPVVLGSATPSLESFSNAREGKYRLLSLPRRVTPHDLPVVTVVELGPEFYRPDGSGLISDPLDRMIRARLAAREQVLLFLNRRGFATFIHCLRCGFVKKCSECDVALTFHRQKGTALCHLCNRAEAVPEGCPECGAPGIRRSGAGTERILADLARRYPEARTARLDSDVAGGHHAMRSILDRFAGGAIDILVGTQMVAKGLDFPGVSLVGIICADTGLHFPDFRAAERTFQLVTQVAGRAGRGDRLGRVVVQTFSPRHYALKLAVAGDFEAFFETELIHRKALGYPPAGRVAKVVAHGPDQALVREAAAAAGEALRGAGVAGVTVLGPAEAPIARIQGRWRFQLLLKSRSAQALKTALAALPARRPRGVEMTVDVDPQALL
jgi:primosomal protein N' (replication factor Y) (superfamily II helicase)